MTGEVEDDEPGVSQLHSRVEAEQSFSKEVSKGVWGMPRLSEAKKDVVSCEKLRGSANRN